MSVCGIVIRTIVDSTEGADPDDDNWEDGRGWRVPGWGPPTRGLSFEMGGMRARLQDWYTLASFLQIPEKLAIVCAGITNFSILS